MKSREMFPRPIRGSNVVNHLYMLAMNGCKLITNTGFSEQGKSQKTETSKIDFLNQRDHGPIPQAKTTKLQLCWKAFPQVRDVMRKSCPHLPGPILVMIPMTKTEK